MKNKKFLNWLHRLPVLLLALILAVMPLTMAAPAYADVLSSDIKEFDGYTYMGSYVYVENNVEHSQHFYCASDYYFPNVPCVYYCDVNNAVDDTSVPGVALLHTLSSITIDNEIRYNSLLVRTYDCVFRESHEVYDDSVVSYMFIDDFVKSNVKPSSPVPLNDDIILFYSRACDFVSSTAGSTLCFPFSRVHILDVFSGVGSWISGAVQNISTMFWTVESGMTVLGYLAVASLAVAVILLIFYLIAGWLKFH